MTRRFLLSESKLEESAAIALLDDSRSGGIVTFVGRVRDHARGRAVSLLEYEAYPEMVERVFEQIAGEAKARYAIDDVVVHHRVGTLKVGEVSVVIAVSAEHRAAAFDACRYVIDELKARAPIWKKEHGPGGALWIDERP